MPDQQTERRDRETVAVELQAFLCFSLGPVQPFIASARSVRDLWTGSFILAWLTRRAMKPVDDDSNAKVVTPHVPPKWTADNLRQPCLPNRFVAVVPMSAADDLAEACRSECLKAWQEVCEAVHSKVDAKMQQLMPNGERWDRLWESQVGVDGSRAHLFDIRTTILTWQACGEDEIGQLLTLDQRSTSEELDERLWLDRMELLGRLQAVEKMLRNVPDYRALPDRQGRWPQKCSLLGSYEQMGPATAGDSADFWDACANVKSWNKLPGTNIRAGERLCAVSLVKRFAWPAKLAKDFNARPDKLRSDDTATVAAAEWLDATEKKSGIVLGYDRIWNGHWLHWPTPDHDEDETECPSDIFEDIKRSRDPNNPKYIGPPPIYYAILMLDGDNMGDKFRLAAGEEHHGKISVAISKFASDHVPTIIDNCMGTLIYVGGDDVLAMLPTSTVLQCAEEISGKFAEHWQAHDLPDKDGATVSAGIAVVHYKEDLRFALDMARTAERSAKDAGKDALRLAVCRRSGQHTSALCPWSFANEVSQWIDAFRSDLSDRWTYHLAAELPTLTGMNPDAISAEIRRLVGRSNSQSESRGAKQLSAEVVDGQFQQYRKLTTTDRYDLTDAEALSEFVTLCQTASFLARGRDR